MRCLCFLLTSLIECGQLLCLNPSWEPSEFIAATTLYAQSDVGFPFTPDFYCPNYWRLPLLPPLYASMKEGDLAYVHARHVGKFCREILPSITTPFVMLVCSDCDDCFPSDVLTAEELNILLKSDKILHVFAWNCDYSVPSNKLSPLPLGLDFSTKVYPVDASSNIDWSKSIPIAKQESLLKDVLSHLQPTYLRKKASFVDFQLNDTMARATGSCARLYKGETRTSIFNLLLKTGLIEYGPHLPVTELWKKKGEYAFCISPHGHGLDCIRTWEDLVLGCIVIVKTSPLDPLYEGLPVVIVQDWNEVTEENLDRWLLQYGDAFTNPSYREKLTTTYWLNKIKAVATEGLK